MNKNKLDGVDLYGLLGLTIHASLTDIRKAYRKKALKYHPDKNPDNPKAAELFVQITEALEILLDGSARAAYDKLLKAKEAARLRHKEFDDKRKKFKEDLEAREEAYFAKKEKQKSEEEKLQEEIIRLRNEGAKLVQDEIRLIQEEIKKELQNSRKVVEDGGQYKIKIEWYADQNDETNGGYNEENLEKIFRKYGDITALVMSSKIKGQALIEFEEKQAAELAMKIELGLMHNPLKLKWINKNFRLSKNKTTGTQSLVTERDYESLVLRQMRQAEERKRLIEQLKTEDDEN